jgi:hypothetical protein
MCNIFTDTFLRVARECIPTKMVTVRNNDRPWFNSELRREIRKRDRNRKTVKKYSKLTISRRKLSFLSSISGRGTFASSNEEIKLKYSIRNSDRPWFNSELRREIRKRDRIRKTLVLHPELYFGEGVYYYILY